MKNVLRNTVLGLTTLILAVPALAQEAATTAAAGTTAAAHSAFSSAGGWLALAAGIAMGLAVFGGAIGQSKVAAAALDGTARNPAASGKFTAPLFVGLALIESLVLFAFVIAIQLVGQNGSLLSAIVGK
jgi:F-type H+-transporting ATPase subunit c